LSRTTLIKSQKLNSNAASLARFFSFLFSGTFVGSGIYAMVGLVTGETGGAAWMSFGIAALFALLTIFSYAQLITKYPKAAGASLYVNKAFSNDILSFLVTFCLLAAGLSAVGSLAQVFGGRYFQEFLPSPTFIVAALFVLGLALLNFRGISESIRANFVMSLLELSGLIIILVIGAVMLFTGQVDLSRPFEFNAERSPFAALIGGATLAFFALIGFENAANVAEETKNPSRAYPTALFGGLIAAGLLYMAVSFTASMVVPLDTLANSTGPLLEVVNAGPLPIPGWVFSFIALAAVTNTALLAHIMVSRVLYGMAKEGVVPGIFSKVHSSRRTPWVAILFATVAVLAMIATADLARLADTTVLFILIVFILVHVSLLRLRRDKVNHEHFRAPTFIPYLGIAAAALLLSQQAPGTWLYAGVIALIGLGACLLNVWARRRWKH
jgi:basic amino acid/polyamine antiporter, APA family